MTVRKHKKTGAIIVGGEKEKRHFFKKPALIVAIIALLALFGGTLWYMHARSGPSLPPGVTLGDQPGRYVGLTPDAISEVYESRTTQKLSTVTDKPLSGATLKNFGLAHETAQALHGLGRYDDASRAYVVAAQKASHKQADYTFYLEYADVANKAGDAGLSTQLIGKARTLLEHDSSVSAATKKSELARIDQILRLRKLGY